jgi:hypothetical protein
MKILAKVRGRCGKSVSFRTMHGPRRTQSVDQQPLNRPIHVAEYLYSTCDFAEHIQRDALGVVRLIADNLGDIRRSMPVGSPPDAHGLECTSHNWDSTGDMAMHFRVELALPNSHSRRCRFQRNISFGSIRSPARFVIPFRAVLSFHGIQAILSNSKRRRRGVEGPESREEL